MPGASWARAQADAGPYINVKNIYRKAAQASTSDTFGGWAAGQSDAVNFNMIRFADVLLWAAECEVEVGSQALAEKYVNLVRARAAEPSGWVMGRLTGYGTTAGKADATKPIVDNTLPAANYKVSPYTGQITAGSKEFARQAVWFERKLELAMEGHRFFDLQRYDGRFGGPEPDGYMAGILNTYIKAMTSIGPIDPATHLSKFFPNSVLNTNGTIAVFTKDRNEIYPIPQPQIDIEKGALKQNTGGY
jgi:starch-binding outer membrane protein, SusD/RagB family